MPGPINNIFVGGVQVNANQVRRHSSKDGKNTIVFKSGETLTYPDQKERKIPCDSYDQRRLWDEKEVCRAAEPKVTLDIKEGTFWDDTHFSLNDIMGATFITSTATVAKVVLKDCDNTTVNLAANDSSYYGDKAIVKGGSNNKVILDDEDTADINGHRIGSDSAGVAAQKDY